MRINEIELDKDKVYILCQCQGGDLFIFCGFVHALIKKYNADVIFIIKKSHEAIMELCNYKNYIVADWEKSETYGISNNCPKIQKGKIFVGHWTIHDEINRDRKKKKMVFNTPILHNFLYTFSLPEDTKLIYNIKFPEISVELKNKLDQIAPLNKIVLLSPEAVTLNKLSNKFWEKIVEDVKANGFVPISSVIDEKNKIKGSIYLPLNLSEAIAVAYNCAHVYALRSGFCDYCFPLQEKLSVFYGGHSSYNCYNMTEIYGINDINESIIDQPEKNREYQNLYIFGLKTPIRIISKGNDLFLKIGNFCIFRVYDRYHFYEIRFLGISIIKIK